MNFSRRAFLTSCSAAALTACGGSPTAFQFTDLPPEKTRTLLVVTNRAEAIEETPDQIFSPERTAELKFREYEISIPPQRDTGDFSYPNRNPDPQKNFFVSRSSNVESGAEMLQLLGQRTRALDEGERGVFAIVHGFNISYPGAIFRAAQISEDFDIKQPTVLFSWPSGARVRHYAYDRDSVLYSRDDAVVALRELARSVKSPINILAHSMGCFLTMEAMKQLAVAGDEETLKYITGVFLMHADLDVDVFRRQMVLINAELSNMEFPKRASSDRKGPTFIVAFTDTDRVLNFSRYVAGWQDRLGNISNKDKIKGLNVEAIDLTDVKDDSQLRHVTFRASDALKAIVEQQQNIELILDGALMTDDALDSLAPQNQTPLADIEIPPENPQPNTNAALGSLNPSASAG